MKTLIRKMIPPAILKIAREYLARNANTDAKNVFTKIYKTNKWSSSESRSGRGSEISRVQNLITALEKLLKELEVKSFLDVPCGDFNWMSQANLQGISYIGGDIVDDLIQGNKEKYQKDFRVVNLIKDPLPKSDIIMVRDCLVHLSYNDIFSSLANIKASGSTYLLTTTFTEFHSNHDIATGAWRRLNLQEAPFNFAEPMILIDEKNLDKKDKFIGLWKISDL